MKIKFESRNDEGETMKFPFVWQNTLEIEEEGEFFHAQMYIRYESGRDISLQGDSEDFSVCTLYSACLDDYAWVRRWHGKIIIEA